MAAPPHIDLSASPLHGALPDKPEDLLRLHRLCLRIYGLLVRDVPAKVQALTKAAGSVLRKKDRMVLAQALKEELPVLIALHAHERLAHDPRLAGQGLTDLLRGLLLPCFSLSYQHLYELPADPLKHVLGRVDWYLDGDKGEPLAAFLHFINTVLGERLGDEGPMLEHIKKELLPDLDSRLELAFRYEFG